MRIVVDTHTHTLSSGHAYCTVTEMAAGARNKEIEIMAVTDHGPSMQGSATELHFYNLKALPPKIFDVGIIKGTEANIIDYNGKLDLPDHCLGRLDFVIASFHDICIEPSDPVRHTDALVKVLKNPYVDALGHPGNPVFSVDIERIVSTCAKYRKLIEINNHSFKVRHGSSENCLLFAKACAKYKVRIVTGSDAHYMDTVGCFDNVLEVLKKARVPEELVITASTASFLDYLNERRERITAFRKEKSNNTGRDVKNG